VELEQSTSGDLRGTVQSLQRRLAEMEAMARMNSASATAGVREQGPAALLAEAERREEDARLRLVEREIKELDEEFTEALSPPRPAGGKMLFAASQPNDENRGVNVNVSVPQEYNAYYGDGAGF